jgi:hypothetical protein
MNILVNIFLSSIDILRNFSKEFAFQPVDGFSPTTHMPSLLKSGKGPPHSKTLPRCRATFGQRKAFWSGPVLPSSKRAKAPLRLDGGWCFGICQAGAASAS